jgi:hypothetical protein
MNISQFVVLGALEQIGHGSGYDVLQPDSAPHL